MFQMLLGLLYAAVFVNIVVDKIKPQWDRSSFPSSNANSKHFNWNHSWLKKSRRWLRKHLLKVVLGTFCTKVLLLGTFNVCAVISNQDNDGRLPLLRSSCRYSVVAVGMMVSQFWMIGVTVLEFLGICFVSFKFVSKGRSSEVSSLTLILTYVRGNHVPPFMLGDGVGARIIGLPAIFMQAELSFVITAYLAITLLFAGGYINTMVTQYHPSSHD